jgi:NADPH-dependent curcumin reductase CurA
LNLMIDSERGIPKHSLPSDNRQWLLVSRPIGIPQPSDYELVRGPIPALEDGTALIRNLYLSIDPAQRGWAASGTNYSTPVMLGTPMRALAVGVVVESRTPLLPPGSCHYGWFEWQDYCVVAPDRVLSRADPERAPLSAYAGVLGINGWTAYLALLRLGAPKASETVLVSTAAGAVGSLVGQMARNLGARTIGLTSSREKMDLCTGRFGYQFAIDYRSTDFAAKLAQTCFDGVDVYFDNTGGTILDMALRHMRVGGRVVQCGTAAVDRWDPPPTGLRNEREVLTRRLTWRGFVIFDHLSELSEVMTNLQRWLDAGKLVYDEDISAGIEAAPAALTGIYSGVNRGKRLIWIGDGR